MKLHNLAFMLMLSALTIASASCEWSISVSPEGKYNDYYFVATNENIYDNLNIVTNEILGIAIPNEILLSASFNGMEIVKPPNGFNASFSSDDVFAKNGKLYLKNVNYSAPAPIPEEEIQTIKQDIKKILTNHMETISSIPTPGSIK